MAMAMVMGPRAGPWNWSTQETEQTLERIPGYFNDDGAQGVYLHWQFHESIREGNLTLRDNNQLHPIGTPRPQLDGGNRLEMLLSSVMQLFFDWPSWMTWTVLLWIPINTLAFLPLGLRLWEKRGPAIAAGITWAIMPPVIEQMAAGRLTQVCMVGIPLALAGILGVVEEGRKKDIWMAGLGMALTAFGYWFYALFVLALCPLFIGHGLLHRKVSSFREIPGEFKPMFKNLLRAAGITAAAVLPLALHVFWPKITGGKMPLPQMDVAHMPMQFADALQLMGKQTRGTQHWLPWIILPGMAFSVWKGKRRLLWLGCALACVAFALGPAQSIGPEQYKMPFYPLWRYLPLYGRMFHPERWLLLGGIFLAIGAIDGLARTWHWGAWLLPIGVIAHLWSPQVGENRCASCTFQGTLETRPATLPMDNGKAEDPSVGWKIAIPLLWSRLGQEPGGAVLVVPLLRSNKTCIYQPFHGRPLLGGMVEHMPNFLPDEFIDYFEQSSLLMSTWALGNGEDGEIQLCQTDLDRLHADGFDTVVFDKPSWERLPDAQLINIMGRLTAAFGSPWYTDEGGAIFELPTEGDPSASCTAEGTIRLPELPDAIGDDSDIIPEGPPPSEQGSKQGRRGRKQSPGSPGGQRGPRDVPR
jgi:hypothetical protein